MNTKIDLRNYDYSQWENKQGILESSSYIFTWSGRVGVEITGQSYLTGTTTGSNQNWFNSEQYNFERTWANQREQEMFNNHYINRYIVGVDQAVNKDID